MFEADEFVVDEREDYVDMAGDWDLDVFDPFDEDEVAIAVYHASVLEGILKRASLFN